MVFDNVAGLIGVAESVTIRIYFATAKILNSSEVNNTDISWGESDVVADFKRVVF
jgi:hypothetical protein